MTQRFSAKYKSFNGWKRAKSRKSRYSKRIIRLNKIFPEKSLFELRRFSLKRQSLGHNVNLTSAQKVIRARSFEVLRRMRKGSTLEKASSRVGLSPGEVFPFIGPILFSKRRRWRVKKNDSLLAKMRVITRRGRGTLLVKGSNNRSRIGRYQADVNNYLITGNTSLLNVHRGEHIMDAFGEIHYFEWEPTSVRRISDSISSPELQELYAEGRW